MRIFSLVILPVLFLSCRTVKTPAENFPRIRFVDEYVIPHRLVFDNTVVGGLSGIDHDSATGVFYLVSDDRSNYSSSRFYRARIQISGSAIDSILFLETWPLLQPTGRPYRSWRENLYETTDPESIRYDALRQRVVWTSEGERFIRNDTVVLVAPSIRFSTQQGRHIDSIPLAPRFQMHAAEHGPRVNGTLEALCFSADGRHLYAAFEEPLYQDGPKAGLYDSLALVRILKFDASTHQPVAEFAYPIDRVVLEPKPTGAFFKNGVTEILAYDDHRLLVVERSFSAGHRSSNVRVYLADLRGSTDISKTVSLRDQPPRFPVKKTLLLDMDKLGRVIDNIEGVTFGPRLPNGARSLIFIADDDFQEGRLTQILLFEIK